jgi:hypothetical protein
MPIVEIVTPCNPADGALHALLYHDVGHKARNGVFYPDSLTRDHKHRKE